MVRNKKTLLVVVGLLFFGIAGWLGWPVSEPGQPATTAKAPKTTAPAPKYTSAQQAQMREAAAEFKDAKKQNDDKGVFTATQKLAKAIGGKAGAMLSMAASRVVPVHFFGRVIDQNGQGVAGARVKMVIGGGGSMAPGTGKTFFETDAEGYFEVKAKGQGVSIIDVKHPRLADVYYRDRSGKKKQGKHLEATNQYGKKYNWHSYEKKEHPLEIHVWRVGKFEKVKAGSGGFHPSPNGLPSKQSTRLGIVTTCQREQKNTGEHWQEQKGSWFVTFSPIEGGIQEAGDLYLNEAPNSGYQPELTVSMERGSPAYHVRIYPARHYYYYYMKDGKRVYGSLQATFEPYMYDDECRINVKYKYNRSGSRNLAVRSKR